MPKVIGLTDFYARYKLIINIVLKVRVAKITMKKKEIINISLHFRFRCLTQF